MYNFFAFFPERNNYLKVFFIFYLFNQNKKDIMNIQPRPWINSKKACFLTTAIIFVFSQDGLIRRSFIGIVLQTFDMYIQSQSLNHDQLTIDDSRMQKQSLSTNFFIYQNNQGNNQKGEELSVSCKFMEQQHPTKIMFPSREPTFSMEEQLDELCSRFQNIKNILIEHSQHELSLHEKRLNLKSMAIDWQHMQPDLNNKIAILQNLQDYVEQLQRQGIENDQEVQSNLENKFQEYYLERHYGSLKCQFHELNIDEKSELKNDYQEYEVEVHQNEENKMDQNTKSSNQQYRSILNIQSSKSTLENQIYKKQNTIETIQNLHNRNAKSQNILIDDEKGEYQHEFSQSFRQYHLYYDVPCFIEIQIPIVIYKTKEIIVEEGHQKTELSELDDIINKFSQPYQQLYFKAQHQDYKCPTNHIHQKTPKNDQSIMQNIKEDMNYFPNNQIGSIMLNSNINKAKINKKQSIQSSFSYLNNQKDLRLQLNSNLQLDSLKNIGEPLQDDHNQKPPTDRSMKCSSKIQITQKIEERSQLIVKYQQSERLLISQNHELNQKVKYYRQKLFIEENKSRELEQMAKELTSKLEEELQYVEKLTEKLQFFHIEQYEQKIIFLTNQLNLKEQKQQQFQSKINQYEQQLKQSKTKEDKLKIQIQQAKIQLKIKQEQLKEIINMCFEKEEELKYFQSQQISTLQKINQKNEELLEEICAKQQQNFMLKQKITEYEILIEEEGIVMKYEDLQQIKSSIEEKELSLIRQKSQKEMLQTLLAQIEKQYQIKLKQIQEQLHFQQERNANLSNQLQNIKSWSKQMKTQKEIYFLKIKTLNDLINAMRKQNEKHLEQFQIIINQYDHQLLERNQQIYKLKEDQLKQSSKYRKMLDIYSDKSEENLLDQNIILLLQNQRMKSQSKGQHNKYKELYQLISKDYQKLKNQKLSQNKSRQKYTEHLLNEISKLKKINLGLKRYTLTLQQDLISVNSIDKCENHDMLIQHLLKEKEYYLELACGLVSSNHLSQQP